MEIPKLPALVALVLIRPLAAMAECPPAGNAVTTPTFDAALLKEGRFTYQTSIDGKPLGNTVIEIRRAGPVYRVTMNAAEIGQSWEAVVKRSFAPVTAHLAMRSRGVPYEMKLRYDGATITGEELKGGVATPVSAASRGIVIDQRVDWASMMAVKAPAGSSMTLSVFDPSTAFSQLLGKVGAAPDMSGPWGTAAAMRFDYSICKRDHVEDYTVFATRATPRYMLREDMPNGLVSSLVRVEP